MARIPALIHPTRFPALWLAVFLCLLSGTLSATETTAREATSRGIEAFRSGQLEQAAEAFEQALSAPGEPSASLLYNLGVVYYQLERYQHARRQFRQLTRTPSHAPLAHYNLGLIDLAEGQELAAAQSFERAFLLSGDEKIASLARRQLERLDLDTLFRDRAGIRQSWRTLIELRGGSNNNPRLQHDRDEASSDAFAELLLVSTGYVVGDPGHGLRLDLTAINRQFQNQRDQNSSVLSLALHYDRQWSAWHHSPGVSQSWLFDRRREVIQRHTLHYDLERSLGDGRADLALAFSRIDAQGAFDSLSGHQGVAGIGYRHVIGNHQLGAEYRFIRDRREDFTSGDPQAEPGDASFNGFFISQSANRHQVTTRWRYRLSSQWTLSTTLQYRESRFEEPFEVRSGDTRVREDRLDRRFQGRLGLRYRFADRWSLTLQGSHTDNSSTLDFYSFRRNVTTLGLGVQF